MIKKAVFVLIAGLLLLQPCTGATILESAQNNYIRGNYPDALMHYSKILTETAIRDLQPEAMYMTGMCYLKMGNRDMGLRALWQLLSDYPDSSWTDNACFQLAVQKETEGPAKLGEALMLYEMVTARYQNSEFKAASMLKAAVIKQRLGYYKEANDVMNRALELGPNLFVTAEDHFTVATIYSFPKNPDRQIGKAIQHLTIITTQFPASPLADNALLLKGNLLWESGHRQDAMMAFNEVVETSSVITLRQVALENIARIYEESREKDKAAAAFKRLLSTFAVSAETRNTLQKKIQNLTGKHQQKPTISAWDASVNETKKVATYSGNVQINMGKTTILSDNATVDFKTNTIHVKGHVHLQWSERYVIDCNRAECRITDQVAILSGDVSVLNRESRLSKRSVHDRIELSLSSGEIK